MGKSIALALLKHGAEVVVLERLKDDLQKFKEEVRPIPFTDHYCHPFLDNGIFHKATYNKCSKVYFIYSGDSGYNYQMLLNVFL